MTLYLNNICLIYCTCDVSRRCSLLVVLLKIDGDKVAGLQRPKGYVGQYIQHHTKHTGARFKSRCGVACLALEDNTHGHLDHPRDEVHAAWKVHNPTTVACCGFEGVP